MQISFQGKTAWVTGGGGGLGAEIVALLHEGGARVVCTDVIDPIQPREGVLYRKCDVTKQAEIDATAALCRDELGGLDVLVNNAAVLERKGVFDITREGWEKIIAVNLTAYFFCAQTAAKLMRDQGRGGAIVNTVSVGSEQNSFIHYSSSKGGVRSMIFSLAVELAPFGIRVNGVAPGSMETPMSAQRFRDAVEREAKLGRIPLGRISKPREVATAVVYLASDQASYITGEILTVDGGRTRKS